MNTKKVYVIIEATYDTRYDEMTIDSYGTFTTRKKAEEYLEKNISAATRQLCQIVESEYNPTS